MDPDLFRLAFATACLNGLLAALIVYITRVYFTSFLGMSTEPIKALYNTFLSYQAGFNVANLHLFLTAFYDLYQKSIYSKLFAMLLVCAVISAAICTLKPSSKDHVFLGLGYTPWVYYLFFWFIKAPGGGF